MHANGPWTLLITDLNPPDDNGTLRSWTLIVREPNETPVSQVLG
jgi:subtilisin-like proprotein convertase family protein